LSTAGSAGRLFEVTYKGEIVWQYTDPFFGDDERFGRVNLVFRAYRDSSDFPGFQGKTFELQQYAWLNHLSR
jgi:hypothetical protein